MSVSTKIENIISNMTLEEKVGQLCVPILQKGEITQDLISYVCDYHVGMLRYCPNAEFDNSSEVVGKPNKYFSPSEMADFINSIQKMSKIPLFFAVDQEGGSRNDINRAGAFAYGGHMQFGAADDVSLTYEVALATAREFASMGINLVQAPIVDVLTYDGRRTMKAATFGDSTKKVCEHSLAMMKGFRDGGIAVMAKHFPGYGSVATDAHKGIAEIIKDFQSLDSEDIEPMKQLFENGLNGVMTGHVITHCIDDKYPATVSEKVITNYLRKTLGFDGIVETDAMRMPAIQKLYGTAKASVMAIKAGCDLVLLRGNMEHFKEGYEAILDAAENGEILIEQIDSSVKRILLQKDKINLLEKPFVNAQKSQEIVGCEKHKELAQRLADNSVAVLKGKGTLLSKEDRILVVCCEPQKIRAAEDEIQCVDMLEKAVKRYFENTDGIMVSLSHGEDDIAKVAKMLEKKNYDAVVFGCCNAIIYESQCELAKFLRSCFSKMVIVAMESPYDVEIMPEADLFISTFGVSAQSMDTAARIMCGKHSSKGVLPVKINL